MSDILKVTLYNSESYCMTDIMVAWSSSLYLDNDSSSSNDTVKLSQYKECIDVKDFLKCYVCEDYFEKPRILPCGHTYCEKCLLSLRERAVHDFNASRDPTAHRRGECGFFTCPWPNCRYTMRIMNVARWTLKNKAMSRAVAVARKQKQKRSIGSQTHIDGSSVIVSLPAKLFVSSSSTQFSCHSNQRTAPPSPTATVVQHVLQNLVAMDTLDIKHCKPQNDNVNGTVNWRNFAYMFGMAILDQVIKMT